MRGRLLGIATSGLSRIAGLAIPASSVNRVVDVLVTKGHVRAATWASGLNRLESRTLARQSLTDRQKWDHGGEGRSRRARGSAGVLLGDILVSLGDVTLEEFEDLQSVSDLG